MFKFTDAERKFLVWSRALVVDASGQEVLVGLSLDETAEYMALTRDIANRTPESSERYLELHEKHETARFAILHGEQELRHDKPTRQ